MRNVITPLMLSAVFVLTAFTSPSFACSCMAMPTVLDSFENSENVFSARMISVDKIRPKSREFDVGYIRSVSMFVLRVYKGSLRVGQEVKFAQGGGSDCIWTFDEDYIGHEYLFYTGKPTKGHPIFETTIDPENKVAESMFHAVTCGRSRGLTGAVDDLSYLNNIEKVRGRTRLSGQYDSWYTNEPLGAGKTIRIEGKTNAGKRIRLAIKADENGFFEQYDIPPGEYLAFPEIPFGWKINNYMLEKTSNGYREYELPADSKGSGIPVKITDKKHTSLDLYFDIDTAIRGRVLSPTGRPMKGVCVRAVSVDLAEGDYRGAFDCTNEKGEFTIEEMAKGNYLLVVNDDGKKSASAPFGVVFYPGVTDRKTASVVAVEPGKAVVVSDLQIPQISELIELRGKLTYSDGAPIADETVDLVPNDKVTFEDSRIKTDEKGGFVIQVPRGFAGTMSASEYVYFEAYKKCPKIDELVNENGGRGLTVYTNKFEFDGQTSVSNIELVFPFPKCERAK